MRWQKVTREKFEEILEQEVSALPTETARLYRLHAVPIFEQSCWRDETYGVERVFVVARSGNKLVFYDDVEEEFGVEVPDPDGVLRDWGTFRALAAAVLFLAENQDP